MKITEAIEQTEQKLRIAKQAATSEARQFSGMMNTEQTRIRGERNTRLANADKLMVEVHALASRLAQAEQMLKDGIIKPADVEKFENAIAQSKAKITDKLNQIEALLNG